MYKKGQNYITKGIPGLPTVNITRTITKILDSICVL